MGRGSPPALTTPPAGPRARHIVDHLHVTVPETVGHRGVPHRGSVSLGIQDRGVYPVDLLSGPLDFHRILASPPGMLRGSRRYGVAPAASGVRCPGLPPDLISPSTSIHVSLVRSEGAQRTLSCRLPLTLPPLAAHKGSLDLFLS